MYVIGRQGNSLNAPENSRISLISAYVAGADALQFEVQMSADGHLVISKDPTVDRLTLSSGKIMDMTLRELMALDFSRSYKAPGAEAYEYYRQGRYRLQIETLPDLLELLPVGVLKLIELRHETTEETGRRNEFVRKAVREIAQRGMTKEVLFYSQDVENLRLVRELLPDARIVAHAPDLPHDEQIEVMKNLRADGIMMSLEGILTDAGELSDTGMKLEQLYASEPLPIGAILYPDREPGTFTQAEYEGARRHSFIWGLLTASMLEASAFVRAPWTWVDESFAGKEVDTRHYSLGYAKANRYAHVFQDDGVHIKIAAYDEPMPEPSNDPLEIRLRSLEDRVIFALLNSPYYSGGAVGLRTGIEGDFSAEVEYSQSVAAQSTTLEMAVLNVDPGTHHAPWNADGTPRLPRGWRDKDSFFDTHGAPPYVGSEHDEDDGHRINWSLGTAYDNNRYGHAVGDGANLNGRLRLDRRGSYFASYYRNEKDAPGWVCTGVVQHTGLNPRVFLRCAGKRWRKERPNSDNQFYPILANEIIFRNLKITRFA